MLMLFMAPNQRVDILAVWENWQWFFGFFVSFLFQQARITIVTDPKMSNRKNIYSNRYGETNSWGIGCVKTMLVWDGSVIKLIW